MTDKPPPKDEPGAEERFERGLKNALAMARKPHKPHINKLETKSERTSEKRAAPKSGPKSVG